MSKNINQVYMANPITSNASTDLMYFGQSPYGIGNDAAMTYANFSAQFGAPYTPAALTRTNDTNVTLTLGGTPATALLQATSLTVGWAGQLAVGRGGTGNSTFTAYSVICAGTTSTGAFQNVSGLGSLNQVLISQGAGALPQWGSVPGLTPAALTSGNDTNVTLTLGGTPSTALLQASSITAGWTGQLSLTRGGTNASLTANTGGIVYSGASALAILSGTATANLPLLSGSSAAPTWGAFALSLGGAFTTAGALTTVGAFGVTFTFTNTTSVTFPTSGTLATTSQLPTPAALTVGNDTNVTLTLGGTPATALLQAASVTAGWTGQLSLARGGTNANLTAANGAIPYSTASAFALLAAGTSGQLFQSGGAGAPNWTTATFPSTATSTGTILRANGTNWVASTATFADTYAVSTLLYASSSNAVTGLATANSAHLLTNSTGVPTWSATMTNGQVIIGSTGATPTAATLTQGTGITITNGAGSITIASSSNALTYNDVSGTSQAAAVNNGYIISNAGQTTVTLPATAAEGSVIAVQGKGAAGWILAANTGQVIHLGSSASSSAGSLTSTNQWDTVTVVCVTANTTWAASSVIGNLTVA